MTSSSSLPEQTGNGAPTPRPASKALSGRSAKPARKAKSLGSKKSQAVLPADEGPDRRVRPVKALGQHFLAEAAVVERIVEALEPGGSETVIEVGPGTGALTQALLPRSGSLIAVEIDRRLVEELRRRFVDRQDFTLVEADVLGLQPEDVLASGGLAAGTTYDVAGNLPYNAGAAIVRHFLEARYPPRRMVVMLQREVAASMAAAPGDMGLLSVAVQVYARPRLLFEVPPTAFLPPPKVTSAVIALEVLACPLVPSEERNRFFHVVRAGFAAPRKQLRNSLAQGLGVAPAELDRALAGASIDPRLRPQDLAVEDWLRLTRQLGRG